MMKKRVLSFLRGGKAKYRGKRFYSLLCALSLAVVITAALGLILCFNALHTLSDMADNTLRMAVRIYDTYLKATAPANKWEPATLALNEDGCLDSLLAAGLDAGALSALCGRLQALNAQEPRPGDAYYLYFIEEDLALGAEDPQEDARLRAPTVFRILEQPVFLSDIGEGALSCLANLQDGGVCMVDVLRLNANTLLFFAHDLPPLPESDLFEMIQGGVELYFMDAFGNSFAYFGASALGAGLRYEQLGARDEEGFVNLPGMGAVCFVDEASPGYMRFVLVAGDVIASTRGQLIRYVLLISLGLILFGLYGAYAFSRRLFAPVGRLLSQVAPAQGSGEDEFQLIGSAISRLEDHVQAQQGPVAQYRLQRRFLGSGSEEDGEFFFDHRPYVFLRLRIDAEAQDGLASLQLLQQALPEFLAEWDLDCAALVDNAQLCAVCQAEERDLHRILEQFKQLMEFKEKLLISVFLSAPHGSAGELRLAAREAAEAGEHCALMELYNVVAAYEDLPAESPQPREENPEFARLAAYVQLHYRDPGLCAATLCDAFHTSPSGISRMFRRYNDTGFLEYLHSIRIEKAKELLGSTDYSVAQISAMVGYTNALTMTRAFRRYTGATPGSFRGQQPPGEGG